MKFEVPEIRGDHKRLDEILYAGLGPEVVAAGIDLGLFDALAPAPADHVQLAAQLGANAEVLRATCEALVSLGLLENGTRGYTLTPTALHLLVKDSRAFQNAPFRGTYLSCGELLRKLPEIARSGPPELDHQATWRGIDAMADWALGGSVQDVTRFITALPGFMEMTEVCDLGGSHGLYTMTLLDANPRLRGTICDLPRIVALSEALVEEQGYRDRIELRGLDIESAESFGTNFDVLLSSHVIYPWKDRLRELFERINRALKPGGYFISNHFTKLEGRCATVPVAIVELVSVLQGSPGRQFSEEELTASLAEAGFGEFRIRAAEQATQNYSLLLAARKLREL